MSHLVIRQFSELLEKLRNLEDGVVKNSSDAIVSAGIPTSMIQDYRTQITDKRNEFSEAIKNARLIHNEYKVVKDEINDNLIKWQLLLQGKYGRKSRKLMEYGILPSKPRKKRVSKSKSAVPPETTSGS